MNVDLSQASSSMSISPFSLSFLGSSSNNQALNYYSDESYQLGEAIEYMSYMIVGAALLLFFLGYFGCKLQSL